MVSDVGFVRSHPSPFPRETNRVFSSAFSSPASLLVVFGGLSIFMDGRLAPRSTPGSRSSLRGQHEYIQTLTQAQAQFGGPPHRHRA